MATPITQKPLTQKDRSSLRKRLSFFFIFIIFAVVIFTFIYSFILKDFSTNDGFGYIPLVIFGLFGLFFAGLIGYMAWAFIADLKNGVKDCFEGIIEDKRLKISHTTNANSGRSGSRSSTKRSYYMVVDGTKHTIAYDIYNSIKVGEHIYFEVAPKSSAILHYKTTKQEDSEVPRNVATYTRENYPSSKTKQAAFTREDRNILKEFYTKKVKSRLRIIALLSIPIIGLAYKGWASLLIFIFPVPLILIYQLYQFVKLHLNYKKSIAKGRKELTTTLVIDKLFTTISHNGSIRQKYTLKTTYKNVEVPEIIYQNIYAEEEITLHEAKDLKYLLGISVDETYFPVL